MTSVSQRQLIKFISLARSTRRDAAHAASRHALVTRQRNRRNAARTHAITTHRAHIMSAWRRACQRAYSAHSATTSTSTTATVAQLDALLKRCELGAPRAPSRIAVGLSGGVDSAVAAWALKQLGHDVTGVLMRNWDGFDERDDDCGYVDDRKSARETANAIGIALDEVDFSRTYWHEVFEPFVGAFASGATPNPDLECNRRVKFGALLRHARERLGAEYLATGHYARIRRSENHNSMVELLRGVDITKDQSYFLASVTGEALSSACFPLGEALKSDIRDAARALNFTAAERRSSAGICFIGRRPFGEFIGEYVESKAGEFVDVETMRVVPGAEAHRGLASYTVGQRAKIGGAAKPWFVVGKNTASNVVYVASGPEHEALFSTSAIVTEPFWVAGEPPAGVAKLRAKTRYAAQLTPVTLTAHRDGYNGASIGKNDTHTQSMSSEFVPSAFSTAYDSRSDASGAPPTLLVTFASPERAVTPGQAVVFYAPDDDVCLGGGIIHSTSRTLFEERRGSQ